MLVETGGYTLENFRFGSPQVMEATQVDEDGWLFVGGGGLVVYSPSLALKIGDLPKTLGFFAVYLGIRLPRFNRDCI